MNAPDSTPIALNDFSVRLGDRLLFSVPSFEVPAGSSSVIVGATGSGKSVLLKAMAGLLPNGVFAIGGGMRIHGREAYSNGKKSGYRDWRRIRSRGLAFIPAETAQAVNPALTLSQNLRLLALETRALVVKRLAEYFSLDFEAYASKYPDEVSGGELQRITLIMLLSREAGILFLDEPTVNLDRQLRKRFADFLNAEILGSPGRTTLMVSHDLDFVRSLRMDRVIALEDSALRLLPGGLTDAPGLAKPLEGAAGDPVLSLEELSQDYIVRGVFGERRARAYADLNVEFRPSHVYGITGPSGCGKTSMIRAILRLVDRSEGRILFNGKDLVALKPRESGRDPAAFKPYRRRIAVVQQDSRYSFFPDLRIKDSLREIHKALKADEVYSIVPVQALMERIRLPEETLDCYPASLSSGEMKRMDIVRVLASRPEVILLDEPFAHIDFETRSLVMRAISEYLAESGAVLIVVTHEDYDLKFFIQTDYDFLSIARSGAQGGPRNPEADAARVCSR